MRPSFAKWTIDNPFISRSRGGECVCAHWWEIRWRSNWEKLPLDRPLLGTSDSNLLEDRWDFVRSFESSASLPLGRCVQREKQRLRCIAIMCGRYIQQNNVGNCLFFKMRIQNVNQQLYSSFIHLFLDSVRCFSACSTTCSSTNSPLRFRTESM